MRPCTQSKFPVCRHTGIQQILIFASLASIYVSGLLCRCIGLFCFHQCWWYIAEISLLHTDPRHEETIASTPADMRARVCGWFSVNQDHVWVIVHPCVNCFWFHHPGQRQGRCHCMRVSVSCATANSFQRHLIVEVFDLLRFVRLALRPVFPEEVLTPGDRNPGRLERQGA